MVGGSPALIALTAGISIAHFNRYTGGDRHAFSSRRCDPCGRDHVGELRQGA
jgi:hypothetical protein